MSIIHLFGNGFDLAHGIKSAYHHFMFNLLKSVRKSNAEVENVFDLGAPIFQEQNDMKFMKGLINRGKVKNQFIMSLYRVLNTQNWCDIEAVYFNTLKSRKSEKDILNLNLEFEEIKELLQKYLKDEDDRNIASISEYYYESYFSKYVDSSDLVLNFNYTSLIHRYVSNSNIDVDILQIHGKLFDLLNPIIFGYAANKSDSKILLDKGNDEYMKNIKRFAYKRSGVGERLKDYMSNQESIEVNIIGHSCGLSDNLILNEILGNEKVRKIRYFYYEDYDNYRTGMLNISRIIGDEATTEKLVSYPFCNRIAQHNDDENQKHQFQQNMIGLLNSRDKFVSPPVSRLSN